MMIATVCESFSQAGTFFFGVWIEFVGRNGGQFDSPGSGFIAMVIGMQHV